MANRAKAVLENVPGSFFVDTTCIDCDTCRQLAPQVFGAGGEFSYVQRQPAPHSGEERQALRALLACPTGSIGSDDARRASEVRGDFPLQLADGVYYCGYTSPKSFGGSSYFVRHPAGNWLIDSPKFLDVLARSFAAWGGIRHIFLTHRDDVADADRYAQAFGAQRIIHRRELAAQPAAERILEGIDSIALADDFLAIPTPGHTAGHCVLLYKDTFFFTGDHLWWDRDENRLGASRDYCWWNWPEQIASLRNLLDYPFSWVLPGHGDRVHLPADQMRAKLAELVHRLA
jgi:glyoxylase-like metal-dependent hydrolase (beta-lactamase superfamily II)/ferredoxin